MKKGRNIICFIIVTIIFFSINEAIAKPIQRIATFTCPKATFLYHNNFYILGYGTLLFLDQQERTVDFYSYSDPAGLLENLNKYSNSGTKYSQTTGIVSCLFHSPDTSEPDFSLTYQMSNGKEGIIQSASMDKISILIPLGST